MESEKSNSVKNETSTSDNIIEATTAKKSEADEITIKDDEIIAPAYKLEPLTDFLAVVSRHMNL